MEKFLNLQYNLTSSSAAENAPGDTAEKKVESYLDRLEDISTRETQTGKFRGLKHLEDRYLRHNTIDTSDEHVTKMAYALYESEKQQAINEGHGGSVNKEPTEEVIDRHKEEILKKAELQKKTLKNTLDYVVNNEDNHPQWFRYFMLRSVVKMGVLNAEEHTYTNRSSSTVAPFPQLPLNHEAIGFVRRMVEGQFNIGDIQLSEDEVQSIEQQSENVELTDQERDLIEKKNLDPEAYLTNKKRAYLKKERQTRLRELKSAKTEELAQSIGTEQEATDILTEKLKKLSFAELYAFAQIEVSKDVKHFTTEGSWTKYDEGSNPEVLTEVLQGKGTGWCTAEGSAPTHLQGGDFYVYNTYTQKEYLEKESGNEDIEPSQPGIAVRMLNGQVYEVRGTEPGQEMSPELIDIAAQKYEELPGGDKFVVKREHMKRLTEIYRTSFDTSGEEKKHLNPELSKDELRFLYGVDGKIQGFGYGEDPRIEELLEGRDRHADLAFVLDCRPDQISLTKEEALSGDIVFHGGGLNLGSLTSAENLTLPNTIGGYLNLGSLTTAEGLTLPDSVGGYLYLGSLTSAEGLTLPDSLGGYLNLGSLTSAEGLTLPDSLGGYLNLESLTSAEGLTLPNTISGGLYLNSLTSAEGLTLPDSVGGGLNLGSLTSAEGLTLPDSVGGYLNLESLTSAEGLTLPNTISGGLYLNSLTSAEGLTLPDSVGGDLNLNSLTSAEGLTLPDSLGGNLYLSSLPEEEKQKIRERYPQHANNIR